VQEDDGRTIAQRRQLVRFEPLTVDREMN